ncbi:MAG: hypothetical protein RLZZ618_3999, partial [Pseudomonadota bacterium]
MGEGTLLSRDLITMNATTSPLASAPSSAGALPMTKRIMRLIFPKNDGPKATLLAHRLEASEGLSRDFEYTVEALSSDANIALKDVQGKMVTIELEREEGGVRYFNGYVFEFRLLRMAQTGKNEQALYGMVLRPWMAFLRLRRDNYVFHGKTLKDVTTDTFKDHPQHDYKFNISGKDPQFTDASQWSESDHNHLHRRWEDAGWYYLYEHRRDGHKLVLCDDSRNAEAIERKSPEITWRPQGGLSIANPLKGTPDTSITAWTPVRQLVAAKAAISSFDFKNPRPKTVDVPTVNQQGEVPKLEVYDYEGALGFKDGAEGDAMVRRRMEAIEAGGKHFEAAGTDRHMLPGRWFKLKGHADAGVNGVEMLILEVRHSVNNNHLPGTAGESKSPYASQFSCIRKTVPWRAPRNHHSTAPKLYGLQTAIVVGPKGEEIHTDEYGRVRVQYHWDREGKFDDRSSAWVRVATPWAGSNFGMTSVPRVGTEVIVQFLDGNPDRPIITGCVPNADTLPPWELPVNKTQSGILSRSTPGGSYSNANALRFEDKKGQEQVWLHAERNLDVEAERDRSTTVGHNDKLKVSNNSTTSISGMQTTTVKLLSTETVGLAKATTVGAAYQLTVGGLMNTSVAMLQKEQVGLSKSVTVGTDQTWDVGQSTTTTIGTDKKLNVGKAWDTKVGGTMSTTVTLASAETIGLGKA